MSFRRLIVTLLLTALAATAFQVSTAFAAVSEETREALQVRFEELRERLALTPEQEAKIAPLVEARNAQLNALRTSGSGGSRRERLATLREARSIQQRFVEQVEPLLTKEQRKEWAAIRSEMKQAAKERRRDR